MNTKQPILYVEHDANEVLVTRRVFEAAEIANPLHVAADARQGITYLTRASIMGDSRPESYPCLVMLDLDLDLPGVSGVEMLEWIRSQPALAALVVIVLSSSEDPEEVAWAYRVGANSFVRKPAEYRQRLDFARLLKGWWLQLNQTPPTPEVDAPTQPEALQARRSISTKEIAIEFQTGPQPA